MTAIGSTYRVPLLIQINRPKIRADLIKIKRCDPPSEKIIDSRARRRGSLTQGDDAMEGTAGLPKSLKDERCWREFTPGHWWSTIDVRDFIVTIGSVFDAVVSLVDGGDDVIPSEDNVEKFIEWVHAHDMYQVPDLATGILRDQEALNGDTAAPGNDDLRLLPRQLILQLNVNNNVSLGSGYRAYPGYSAAQVRQQFGSGW